VHLWSAESIVLVSPPPRVDPDKASVVREGKADAHVAPSEVMEPLRSFYAKSHYLKAAWSKRLQWRGWAIRRDKVLQNGCCRWDCVRPLGGSGSGGEARAGIGGLGLRRPAMGKCLGCWRNGMRPDVACHSK
jgi:hypothetical protein